MSSSTESQDKLPSFDTEASFRYTKSPNPSWKFGDGQNGGNGVKWADDEKLRSKSFDPVVLGNLLVEHA